MLAYVFDNKIFGYYLIDDKNFVFVLIAYTVISIKMQFFLSIYSLINFYYLQTLAIFSPINFLQSFKVLKLNTLKHII